MPPLIRVMLVDNQTLTRAGLHLLIERHPRFQVVGEVEATQEALTVVGDAAPDIILLDMDNPQALSLLPPLSSSGAAVIILMGAPDNRTQHEAVRQGARGIVLKEQRVEALLTAIEKVHAGEVWFSRSVMAEVLSEMLNPSGPKEEAPHDGLTEREYEVIEQVGQGLKNQEIGVRLHISESTVRHHLTSIYSKLGVSDRLELLIYAYRHNLIKRPSLKSSDGATHRFA